MNQLQRLYEKAQGIKEDAKGHRFRCYRPFISYSEHKGYTVTIYYADNFLELLTKTLTETIRKNESKYLQEHTEDSRHFKTTDGIKEYIDGIVKGRKPCVIGGECDKPQNRDKLQRAIQETGYMFL